MSALEIITEALEKAKSGRYDCLTDDAMTEGFIAGLVYAIDAIKNAKRPYVEEA